MTRYLVVGNGVAGVTAAQAIASAEPGADIHIYAAEPYPYYRRPQLPDYIAGQASEQDITYRPSEWYERQGIQVHLACRVEELDPQARRVGLADGSSVTYDRLLLASGGWAWTSVLEGGELGGIFTLRTLDDARAIRERAGSARHAVVVGGGLLGLESARALRALGLEVTLLELFEYLLPRQIDREGAAVLQGIVERQGIRVLTDTATAGFAGSGTVAAVRTRDGRELPAELVICAAGWRAETTLAGQAGLAVGRGVRVDEYLQTSAADVYAAGDVAEAGEQLYGIVPAAIEQARVAAANMVRAGSVTYASTLTSTTLKVAGAEITSLGNCIPQGDEFQQLRHIAPQQHHYRKFVLQDGRIVGAILLNERARALAARQLIERRIDVSDCAGCLVNDDFDLQALLDSRQPS